jgi:hypothetical protein
LAWARWRRRHDRRCPGPAAPGHAPVRPLGPDKLAAALRHEWLAALDGLADIDTVLRAVETIGAYLTGALKRGIADLRVERATGLSKRDWQRTSGPQLRKMLATSRFPALARPSTTARRSTPSCPSRPVWTGPSTPWPPNSPDRWRDAHLCRMYGVS